MEAWTILLSLLLSAHPLAESQRSTTPLAVEVWTGGDDGLTQRLAEVVKKEFRASSRFVLADAGTDGGALRVIIPTHVDWREVGPRTRVTYRLELERDGRRIALSGGACWEVELRQCARQVVHTVETHR